MELEQFDPKIEINFRIRRQKQRLKELMERHEHEHEEEHHEGRHEIGRLQYGGTAMHLQEIFCEKCGGEHYIKDCQDSALKKAKLDAQFGKFLEVFKKLRINIPFPDALMQMPSYAKFLKDILASKRKLEDHMTVNLTENCSALDALRDPLEATFTTESREDELDAGKSEILAYLNANQQWKRPIRMRLENLGDRRDLIPQKSSLEEPPTLELKPLPPHLKYVYLGENNKLHVIISSSLTDVMEEKLLKVLKAHKSAFAWKVADIKGINPSVCMHKILMEEKYSPLVQPQRRLNPKMQEVVKAETIKLLDACIIYPISDSAWVSHVQCVPKKGGTTVITNEKNELIPTRTVTGWRVCINYRKLNDATLKDHFPLPFIDQMLERLAGHEFYCFLDGYSGYNQITIATEYQEKTTFTCPYGTFAFHLCLLVFNLKVVLMRCEETNLVLNWELCHFMVQEGIVLGHKISQHEIEVDKAKVEVIKNLPPPTSIKRAYEDLNERLVTAPVLVAPDWDLPFEVLCDASDTAVGAVLGQRRNKVFHTIYYASERHLLQLDQLEEFRNLAYDLALSYKEKTKRAHDRRIIERKFKKGENVLVYNSRCDCFPEN
ncbi:uncharacterized protein LOC142542039 [Primulina tabacum]|uniref:uncharacterized protein LOC142542039 n=1 Tax=Primulina tabacum TaxID=48773 RepID=UPI003F5A18A7